MALEDFTLALFATWCIFLLTNVVTVAYALVNRQAVWLAGCFAANAVCCFVILGITFRKRRVARRRVDGAAGLAYRHSHRVLSNRRRSVEHWAEVLRPVRAHDRGNGPTPVSEMLLPVAVGVGFIVSQERDVHRLNDAILYTTR